MGANEAWSLSEKGNRRVAVVTGASKGIGREISIQLASAGFHIAVNYFGDERGAMETAERVAGYGVRSIVVRADVGMKSDVDQMFDYVLEKLGTPDALVNNAGVQTWKPLLDLKEEEWDRTLRTNLKGTFLCTQRAAKHMAARGQGHIVNIGSGCNKVPFPNLVDYTSSKGGVEMFTRVSAVELGPHGINVNCVAPGTIEIERTKTESTDYASTWRPHIPVGRIGQPSDVAAAVAFLLSAQASFISGQTIYVDGACFSQGPWPYPVQKTKLP